MNKLHIDFETRSEIDLKKAGTYTYAHHPSTEILCCGYAVGDEPVHIIKRSAILTYGLTDLYSLLSEVVKGKLILTAFNAYFERNIFRMAVKKYLNGAYPDIWQARYWQCTMAKTCMFGLAGNLDKVGMLLGLEQTKDTDGHKLMMSMTKPRTPTRTNPNKWRESEGELKRLYQYCKIDVEVERNIDNMLPGDMPEKERKIWLADQKINDTGFKVDIPLVKKAVEYSEQQKEYANRQIEKITDGQINTTNQVGKIKDYINENSDLNVDSVNKQSVEACLELDDTPIDVKNILELRNQNSQSSIKKYQSLLDMQSDGIVRGCLVYHQASTGRWAGRGFQPHNLPRGLVKDIDTARWLLTASSDIEEFKFWTDNDINKYLSALIRTAVIPSEGCSLVVADYSAIEFRVLVWLAEDKRALHNLKLNDSEPDKYPDSYVLMARSIYKNNKLTKADSYERYVGKQTVLGCGYGMGVDKFHSQATGYGLDMEYSLAEMCVKTYRRTYKQVIRLWQGVENMVCNAIKNRGKIYHFNRVAVKCSNDWMKIKIPSGRLLWYYKPAIGDNGIEYLGTDSQKKKTKKQYLYGGKLVENIVQATARDILAEALLRVDTDDRYDTILHVHDEIVAETKQQQQHQDFCKLISALPDWADGCPVKAEGWTGNYYRKE